MVKTRAPLIALLWVFFFSLSTLSQPYQAENVELNASLSSPRPYVLEQVTYTLKIISLHPIINASLQPPMIDNQPLAQLGPKKTYQAGGRHVIELQFSLMSKKSGLRVIQAPVLQAMVKMDDDPYSPYGIKQVQATANDVKLAVRSIPSGFTGQDWLPAKRFVVTDDWSPSLDQLKVGQSVTRTLILHAEGVTAEHLPQVQFPAIPGVNVYPDKPEMKTELRNGQLVATKIIKFAFVPTQVGDVSVPKSTIPWWNSQQDKQMSAIIPSATLHVAAAAPSRHIVPLDNALPVQQKPLETEVHTMLSAVQTPWWVWGVAFSGWLAFLLLWFRQRPYQNTSTTAGTTGLKSERLGRLARELNRACQSGKAEEAYGLALRCIQLIFPQHNVLTVHGVLSLVPNDTLAEHIEQLNAVRFKDSTESAWRGDAFWQAFQVVLQYPKTEPDVSVKAALPPLFPVNK